MKRIKLSQGKFAMVDDCDFTELSKYKWTANNQHGIFYAINQTMRLSMHRAIMGRDGVIDHKDGDGLNNTRANLRKCTLTENNRNAKTRKDNTSGKKGVMWHKCSGKWVAYININKKQTHLGSFHTFADAVVARAEAERKYFGEFARRETK